MTKTEKKKLLLELRTNESCREELYYKTLETMGDLIGNYGDYITTDSINCDEELKRLSEADYELCAALLTMLLREDHFCNGSFERRCRNGQIQPIIDRMITLL